MGPIPAPKREPGILDLRSPNPDIHYRRLCLSRPSLVCAVRTPPSRFVENNENVVSGWIHSDVYVSVRHGSSRTAS